MSWQCLCQFNMRLRCTAMICLAFAVASCWTNTICSTFCALFAKVRVISSLRLTKYTLSFVIWDVSQKIWLWAPFHFLLLLSFPEATPVQGRLLKTYSQFAISGVNYHSYGGNRGRRRGVIWGSDWGASEMPRSDWPIAQLSSYWLSQRPGETTSPKCCTWLCLFLVDDWIQTLFIFCPWKIMTQHRSRPGSVVTF